MNSAPLKSSTFWGPPGLLRGWFWRTVRVLPLAATLLGAYGLVMVLCISLVSPTFGVATHLRQAVLAGIFSLFVVFGWVLVKAWRQEWRPHGGLIGLLVLAPVFAFLAKDEDLRRQPMDFATLSEIAPSDAESAALVLRFTRKRREPAPYRTSPALAALRGGPGNADWLEQAARDPEAIRAAAVELKPLTDWWAELAALPRLGDLLAKSSDPVPDLEPMRDLARLRCAQAARLALDGQGDEGLALLLPLIDVANKLELHARSSRRIVAAQAVAGLAVVMADQILTKSRTSPEARARLAATLRTGMSGERGVRRLLAADHAFANEWLQFIAARRSGRQGWPEAAFMTLDYNPNRTVNTLDAVMVELQEHAARRDRAGVTRCLADFRASNSRGIKNMKGRTWLAQLAEPSPAVWRYWEQQDRKAALLARLDAMDAAHASSGAHS